MNPIQPCECTAPARFGRLLPASKQRFNCESLRQLAFSMRPSRATPVGGGKQLPNSPTAAYTYFGQFIDHDLIRDETPLQLAGVKEPSATPNVAGGCLDLHHIYLGGPTQDSHLYEADMASFRLGTNVTRNGETFDLPMDDCGCPASAEDRNTENLILRQICVLFMKLHNKAVSEGANFDEARRRTVETYPYLVVNDFLKQVLNDDTYHRVVTRGERHRVEVVRENNRDQLVRTRTIVGIEYLHVNIIDAVGIVLKVTCFL